MSDADIWRAAQRLLEISPNADVAAIGADGLFVPMPADLPIRQHRVIEGRTSALELVAPAEMGRVIEAWRHAILDGASRIRVEPLGAPDRRMVLHFFDLRGSYGVMLGVVLSPDGLAAPAADPTRPAELPIRLSIVRKNELSEFIAVDESFRPLLGYDSHEVIGIRNLELIHPDDHPAAIASWMELLSVPGRSRRVRLRQRHKDGHWLWFEVSNHNRLTDPSERCVVAEMIDVSREVAADEALRAHQARAGRERQLDRLLECLPVGVLQLDRTGRIAHRNAALDQLLAPPAGPRLTDVFAGLDEADFAALLEAIVDARPAGAEAELRLPIRRSDDRVIRARLRVRAMPEDGGVLICVDADVR